MGLKNFFMGFLKIWKTFEKSNFFIFDSFWTKKITYFTASDADYNGIVLLYPNNRICVGIGPCGCYMQGGPSAGSGCALAGLHYAPTALRF